MILDVDLNGRTHRVTLEPQGRASRYRVEVGDRAYRLEVCWLDETTLSVRDEETARVYRVGFAAARFPGELVVVADGRSLRAGVNRRRRSPGEEVVGAPGEQRIVAPMPGRIVRVYVQPGAEVRASQPLVVIEAMKMENELRSPKTGRVKAVAVEEGMSVEAGRLLAVVE